VRDDSPAPVAFQHAQNVICQALRAPEAVLYPDVTCRCRQTAVLHEQQCMAVPKHRSGRNWQQRDSLGVSGNLNSQAPSEKWEASRISCKIFGLTSWNDRTGELSLAKGCWARSGSTTNIPSTVRGRYHVASKLASRSTSAGFRNTQG